MRLIHRNTLLLSTWCAAAACAPNTRTASEQYLSTDSAGTLLVDTARAPEFAGDRYGVSSRVPIAVYLPPGYTTDRRRRYPVLYMLHGFPYTLTGQPITDAHLRWLSGSSGAHAIDSLIVAGAIGELIVVVPRADGRFGEGSFYTDSPVSGNWETFVARDLVRHVDRRYRTLARAESRGIAGGSGGGYGALRLAMRHPNTYGAVYAQSPCCLTEAAFDYGEEAWRAATGLTRPEQFPDTLHPAANVLAGLAAAWSSTSRLPFYFEWPYRMQEGQLVAQEPALSQWRSNTVLGMLPRYELNLRRLRGLAFDVGRQDQYRFILTTTRALSDELTRRSIPHRFEEYDGDHTNQRGNRIVSHVLPFFGGMLDFAATR